MRILKFVMLLAFWTWNGLAQEKKGYTILGKINDLPDDISFYLIKNNSNGRPDTLDRVKSRNHKFLFRGEIHQGPELHFVKMDTTDIKLERGKKSWLILFLDNSEIQITGNLDHWPELDIRGSIPTEEYQSFMSKISNLTKDANKNVTANKNDSSKISEIKKRYKEMYIEMLKAIPNSYILPQLVLSSSLLTTEEKKAIYESLSRNLKTSFYGIKLKERITANESGQAVILGKIIPAFTITKPNGEVQAIKEIISQSSYTLIDFWASWCVPCRQDIPNLKKLYSAYNNQGFNIVSISIDDNSNFWLKALSDENMPWTNGIEQNKVYQEVFDIMSIPAKILVNKNAEIIAMDYTRAGNVQQSKYVLSEKNRQNLRGDHLLFLVDSLLKK